MTRREPGDLARLRDAFSAEAWAPPGTGCPDAEELWASAAGELDPQADQKILLHLAECAQCSGAWRLAREIVSPGETAEERVVRLEKGRRSRTWRRPAYLAAAATLLIGLGLGTGLLINRRGPASQPVYRQQRASVNIVASPQTQRLPRSACRLRWSAGPAGSRYDLTVTTKDLDILAVVRGLTEPEHLLPPEKIPRSTREILWRVTVHLPGGGSVSSKTFSSRIVD
ncbi:MAG: zf-HC2 domain-containing protein [Acidobacteria bacterium]|nr:zf-HC2 domain-containing protein [Acidobacteriota bacterium]